MKAASVSDYRALARSRLPKFLFEYMDGGAFAETTLARNTQDLEAIALRQRVLRDVSGVDLTTSLFGAALAMPVVLGPIGLGGLAARRGEVQAARAAQKAGVGFCLSTLSACPLSEVTASLERAIWFQLYVMRDRAFMRDLLAQAEAAGCSALVFTVDMPVPGTRYRDYRSGFAGNPGIAGSFRRVCQAMARPRWAWDVGVMGRPHTIGNVLPVLGDKTGLEDYFAWMRDNFDPTVSWDDIRAVRSIWKGPLLLKGILDVEDAKEAARSGVDGIIVSNHGGRQLDGVPSMARALPAIADAVGHSTTVLADGGIRSGLDIVRTLALGARAVLLGRAWAFALAGSGGPGVAHMLELMGNEMRVAMALTGVTAISQIGSQILADGVALEYG